MNNIRMKDIQVGSFLRDTLINNSYVVTFAKDTKQLRVYHLHCIDEPKRSMNISFNKSRPYDVQLHWKVLSF